MTFSQDEVGLLLMAISSAADTAARTPLPADPTAAAETKAEIDGMVQKYGTLLSRIETATTWSG
jgi:hypothetical protein